MLLPTVEQCQISEFNATTVYKLIRLPLLLKIVKQECYFWFALIIDSAQAITYCHLTLDPSSIIQLIHAMP